MSCADEHRRTSMRAFHQADIVSFQKASPVEASTLPRGQALSPHTWEMTAGWGAGSASQTWWVTTYDPNNSYWPLGLSRLLTLSSVPTLPASCIITLGAGDRVRASGAFNFQYPQMNCIHTPTLTALNRTTNQPDITPLHLIIKIFGYL